MLPLEIQRTGRLPTHTDFGRCFTKCRLKTCFLEHLEVSLAPRQKLSKAKRKKKNLQCLQFEYCILNVVEVECMA